MGIGLSLDDFGTGYSSLNYLKRFPLDCLKIDKSFVDDITTDPDDAAIASAIISMARSLEVQVVAEGVETRAQLEFLRAHGCGAMQGYYFSKPLPAEACGLLLREGRRLAFGPTPAGKLSGRVERPKAKTPPPGEENRRALKTPGLETESPGEEVSAPPDRPTTIIGSKERAGTIRCCQKALAGHPY